jgi:hypothetical protein
VGLKWKSSVAGGAVMNEDSQYVVDSEVEEGIKKELQRSDLTPEDRKAYEDALSKIQTTVEKEEPQ